MPRSNGNLARLLGFFVFSPLICDATAQQQSSTPNSSHSAHIVRVRASWSAGLCYGYCATDLTVEKGRSRLVERAFSEKKKYPDLKGQRKLTRQEWDELQQSIDPQAQSALVGRIGCPGCVDEVVESIEVQFSDGTKNSVEYNAGTAPPALTRTVQCINSIRSKFTLRVPPPRTTLEMEIEEVSAQTVAASGRIAETVHLN